MIKILSIAGSDPSGGAGIQADIKTIAAHGAYAMSVITALTAQNTLGIYAVQQVPADFVAAQLEAVLSDIFPDAIKIGVLSNTQIIMAVSNILKHYRPPHIVLDPVMISTSGSKLLSTEAIYSLINDLLPLVHLITPNIPEAEALCGFAIENDSHMEKAAYRLTEQFNVSVLLKGGHLKGCSDDFLMTSNGSFWLRADRIDNPNTHGTGCTLSSAIACHLATGKSLLESVLSAKTYVHNAIQKKLDLGKGRGPLDHHKNI